MSDFLKWFDEWAFRDSWWINIRHSSIVDWIITIGKKWEWHDAIITVQDNDMELAFAKAHCEFKEWLMENEEGC